MEQRAHLKANEREEQQNLIDTLNSSSEENDSSQTAKLFSIELTLLKELALLKQISFSQKELNISIYINLCMIGLDEESQKLSLADCKYLASVDLNNQNFRRLHLSGCYIGDMGCKQLIKAKWNNLKEIELGNPFFREIITILAPEDVLNYRRLSGINLN